MSFLHLKDRKEPYEQQSGQEQEELIAWWLRDMKEPEMPFCTDGERQFFALDIARAIREGTKEEREWLRTLLEMCREQ